MIQPFNRCWIIIITSRQCLYWSRSEMRWDGGGGILGEGLKAAKLAVVLVVVMVAITYNESLLVYKLAISISKHSPFVLFLLAHQSTTLELCLVMLCLFYTTAISNVQNTKKKEFLKFNKKLNLDTFFRYSRYKAIKT